MTRHNILASVLYRMAVRLKTKSFNRLHRKKNRDDLIAQLCAMQFLTHCLGMKCISSSKIPPIASLLHDVHECDAEEFSDLLKEAYDRSDFSDSYEEVLFQMQEALSACILESIQKKKGYIERITLYIKGFHNLPRAFLSVTDRSKISPKEAMEYAQAYLKMSKTAD